MDVRILLRTLWIVALALPNAIWMGLRMAGHWPRLRILTILAFVSAILLALAIWWSQG